MVFVKNQGLTEFCPNWHWEILVTERGRRRHTEGVQNGHFAKGLGEYGMDSLYGESDYEQGGLCQQGGFVFAA